MADLLQLVVSEGAADLHIRVGIPPVLRIHGILQRVEGPLLRPEDTEVGSVKIPKGGKVVMFYSSANRDPSVFPDPHRFDITRDNTKQVGFGAGGPHFCLGANLARREIAVMFDELRRRMPTIEVTSEPDYLQSSFINGIKRMQCAW